MPRQIGLENLTVALVEEDKSTGVVYATPLKLERSIKAKVSPKTSSEKLYSDDSVEEILNNFDSCDVEIEINQLQLKTRALIQGAKIVNGLLVENKDDIAPELALGFRSKKSNGKYRYVWLLKGKFEITEDEYETIGEKPTAQSNSITGAFYGRNFDGNWRIMEDEDSEGADLERIANWFKTVPEILAKTENEPGEGDNTGTDENPEGGDNTGTDENPEGGDSTGTDENPEGGDNTGTDENPEGGDNTGTNENPEGGDNTGTDENPEGGDNTGTDENPEGGDNTGMDENPEDEANPDEA